MKLFCKIACLWLWLTLTLTPTFAFGCQYYSAVSADATLESYPRAVLGLLMEKNAVTPEQLMAHAEEGHALAEAVSRNHSLEPLIKHAIEQGMEMTLQTRTHSEVFLEVAELVKNAKLESERHAANLETTQGIVALAELREPKTVVNETPEPIGHWTLNGERYEFVRDEGAFFPRYQLRVNGRIENITIDFDPSKLSQLGTMLQKAGVETVNSISLTDDHSVLVLSYTTTKEGRQLIGKLVVDLLTGKVHIPFEPRAGDPSSRDNITVMRKGDNLWVTEKSGLSEYWIYHIPLSGEKATAKEYLSVSHQGRSLTPGGRLFAVRKSGKGQELIQLPVSPEGKPKSILSIEEMTYANGFQDIISVSTGKNSYVLFTLHEKITSANSGIYLSWVPVDGAKRKTTINELPVHQMDPLEDGGIANAGAFSHGGVDFLVIITYTGKVMIHQAQTRELYSETQIFPAKHDTSRISHHELVRVDGELHLKVRFRNKEQEQTQILQVLGVPRD